MKDSKEGIRYAIKIADGVYSNGPQMRRMPLNRAKLWTNIGHVKLHIQGVSESPGNKYPPGTEIVEVVVEYREKSLGLVSEYLAEHKKAAAEKRREDAVRNAKAELEAAEKRLAAAKQRVKQFR